MTLRYGGDDHEARCDEAGGDDWVHGQGRRTGLPHGPPFCRARGGVGWTRTVQSCRVATLSMTCAIHGTVALAKLLRGSRRASFGSAIWSYIFLSLTPKGNRANVGRLIVTYCGAQLASNHSNSFTRTCCEENLQARFMNQQQRKSYITKLNGNGRVHLGSYSNSTSPVVHLGQPRPRATGE